MSATVAAGASRDWAARRERGCTALVRLMIWITLNLGWTASRVILAGIAAYFYASSRTARAASRDYLGRVLGRPATAAQVFRHFHVFSSVILERVFFLTGRTEAFTVDVEGLEHLHEATAGGRGCVLLGAHLGSFEALRGLGRRAPMRVRPVMYRSNASAVTAVLEALDPEMQREIIEIGRPDTMLHVREALERGELVGMLADRSPGDGRVVPVPFLGGMAAFPTGPFIAIAGMNVPTLLVYGLRVAPRHYRVRFEPFASELKLPRATRAAALETCARAYAGRLEAQCRAHPYNWFNFFPFWSAP